MIITSGPKTKSISAPVFSFDAKPIINDSNTETRTTIALGLSFFCKCLKFANRAIADQIKSAKINVIGSKTES